MKTYCIEFENTVIEIEIAQNPVIQKWARRQYMLTELNYKTVQWSLEGSKTDFKNEQVQTNIEAIKDSIAFLKPVVLNFNFSDCENAIENFIIDKEQKWLNLLHRSFTSLVMCYYDIVKPIEIWEAVHQINTSVHNLEGTITNPNNNLRQLYPSKMYSIIFTDSMSYAKTLNVWKTPIEETFDHRVNDINFNVWMNEDILGKDLIRCYLDGDDPNNVDISGNLFYTPSILIDSNYAYRDILKSDNFNNWVDKNIKDQKFFNRWPIGNVKNLNDLEKVNGQKIKKVYFRIGE